jgi:WD40 repeat protein
MTLRALLGTCLVLAAGRVGTADGPAPAQAVLDHHGNPLPPGAVARFGDNRLRYGQLNGLEFSPDGKLLAANTDAGVRLWDVKTGRAVHHKHLQAADQAVLSFAPDGGHVLCDRTGCRILDPKTGKLRARLEQAGCAPVGLAFSRDGKRAAVGWTDLGSPPAEVPPPNGERILAPRDVWQWRVMVYELTDGVKPRGRQLSEGTARALSLSADGSLLAVAGDKAVHLWDTRQGKLLRSCPAGVGVYPAALALSPDGRTLAVASGLAAAAPAPAGANPARDEPTVRLWRTASAQEVPGFKAPRQRVDCLRFTADGKSLIGLSAEGEVIRWSASSGAEQERQSARGAAGFKWRALSHDGKALAGENCFVGDIRVHHLGSGKSGPRLEQLLPLIGATFINPRLVGSLTADGSVTFWDPRDGRVLRTHPRPPALRRGGGLGSHLSPDGEKLAVLGAEVLQLFEVRSGKELWRLADDPPGALAFSPDGKTLVMDTDGKLSLWEAATGKRLRDLEAEGSPICIACAPDGRTVAAGSSRSVFVTELASGKVREELKGPEAPAEDKVWLLRYARGGRRLAAFQSALVVVHSLDQGGAVSRHYPAGKKGAVLMAGAISPDGRWVASWHEEAAGITLHDLDSGEDSKPQVLVGGQSWITHLQFSPDNKYLLSTSADGTALVWDLRALAARTKRPPTPPEQLDLLWAALADADARKAGRAMAELRKVPARAVPLLKANLRPVPAPPAGQVERLIADLGSRTFAVRGKAMQALEKLHDLAEPALRAALARKPTLEAARRLTGLLEKLQDPVTDPERLRAVRAVELLERIGTREAQQVLEALAAGAPAARLTREARAALERLSRMTASDGA